MCQNTSTCDAARECRELGGHMLNRYRLLLLASPLCLFGCGTMPASPIDDDSAELALQMAAGSVAVYGDGLQSGFVDGSWCVRNLTQGAVVHGGTLAASMTPGG